MTERTARRLASLVALLAAGCQAGPDPVATSRRPNIVFIFSDDHATHAISAYGSRINRTPHIDRLAAAGMLFRSTFCGNSICGPSRATILTGLHSHANGFMRNGNRFDPGQPTFPKLLQRAGYTTAMIGKWHLTSDPTGFDYWRVLPGQGNYYNPEFKTPEGREKITGYATDVTTDLALGWLRDRRDPRRPFLLMCQHKAPHRSWEPGPDELGLFRDVTIPEPPTLFDDHTGRGPAAGRQEMEIDRHMYLFYDLKLLPTAAEQARLVGPDRMWKRLRARLLPDQLQRWDAAFAAENRAFRAADLRGRDLVRWKYQRYIKNYLRCVAGVDKSVGRILDYIDRDPELKANTVVVYSSDQGFYLGDGGWYDKRWMYEPSLRMPFIVRWPGRVPAGTETTALTQNIDFCPTFLDLAGVPVPDHVHGVSLLPVLTGGKQGAAPPGWRDAVYYHYYESQEEHNVGAHYGVRNERYKLIYFYDPENRYWELYDLESDPGERRNVYGEARYADVVADLKRRLARLREQYGDTTGTVGDFDLAAGVASVTSLADGALRIRSNARGTYLLRVPGEALQGSIRFACTARPGVAGAGDGLILLTGEPPRRRLLRAGIDFGRRRLVLVDGTAEIASRPLQPAGGAWPEITVTADTAAHTVVVRAGGVELSGALPASWDRITAYGYGLSDCTAEFSPITAATR